MNTANDALTADQKLGAPDGRVLTYRLLGGSVQVKIDTFAELKQAVRIPATQWVATSVPLPTLVCDPRFLNLLDQDDNNRVRVEELQKAVAWLAVQLKSDAGVDQHSDVLVLDHLANTPQGDQLRDAALAVLDAIGTLAPGSATDRNHISATQVKDAQQPLREAGINGDGIVAPRHLPEKLRELGDKIRRLYPETKNRGGEAGLAKETLQAFVDERERLLTWKEKRTDIFIWGEASHEKAQRIEAVRARIEEHFLLCRLVASQPDARERFRLAADKIESLVGDRAALEKALHSLPVAPPNPAGIIAWSTLHRGPAWEELTNFGKEVAGPITNDVDKLTEDAWRELARQAGLILAWHRELQTSPLAPLLDELAALDGRDLAALQDAQDKDLAQAARLTGIDDLERVVLYQRWLIPFANSFISMPDLYTDTQRSLFERGEATLAGRRYVLSVLVPDLAAHRAQTEQGTTCVLYAHIQQKDGTTVYDVAIPKTRGWSTEISVGKRGIFYDVAGTEFDAVITHVVRHPVSVIEAALTPFIRLGELINKKVESLGASADAALQQKSDALSAKLNATKDGAVAAAAVPAGGAAPLPAPTVPVPGALPPLAPTPPAPPSPPMGNALAAGGLAVAAVGSSIAFVANQLKALTVVDVLSIIAVLFVAVAVPSGFLGWLKLRRRNLAQLLEGSGWALNDRLRMTRVLAAIITQRPPRPAGSRLEAIALPLRGRDDEEPSRWWWGAACLGLVVAWGLWHAKDPVLRGACHERSLPESVCAALQYPVGVDEEPSP